MTNDYSLKSIRAASILTSSYVASDIVENSEKYNKAELFIKFAKGSLTDCQIKIEFSNDGTNYFQKSSDAITSGVNTLATNILKLTADNNFSYEFNVNARFIKISAIGTGTATSSSLALDLVMRKTG